MAVTDTWTQSLERSVARLTVKWGTVALIGILIVAALFRLSGIASGLPAVTYDDESFLVDHFLAISWQDLNPHVFVWGTFLFHLLRMLSWSFDFLKVIATGTLPAYSDYYLLARLVSAIAGVATVFLIFILGKLLGGTRIGLLCAAVFAVSPFAVQEAHFANVESTLGLFAALSFIGLVLWLKGNKRGLALAGIAAGLAMATKYNAAILLLPIAWVGIDIAFRERKEPQAAERRLVFALALVSLAVFLFVEVFRAPILQLAASWTQTGQLRPVYSQMFDKLLMSYFAGVLALLILALGLALNWNWARRITGILTNKSFVTPILLAVATFLIVSPFVVLDFPGFIQGFFYATSKQFSGPELPAYALGTRSYAAAMGDVGPIDYFFYVRAIVNEWGPWVLACMLPGLLVLWNNEKRALGPLVSVIVVTLVTTASGRYPGTRYIYVLWIPFSILAGLGIHWVLTSIARLGKDSWTSRVAQPALVILLLLPAAMAAYDRDMNFFSRPDTRTQAVDWIEQNVPTGSFILREWNTPSIEQITPNYRVHFTGFPFEEASLAAWEKQGVKVIVTSDDRYSFYSAHAAEFPDVLAEYAKLEHDWKLVSAFKPGTGVKGPPIYIYAAP